MATKKKKKKQAVAKKTVAASFSGFPPVTFAFLKGLQGHNEKAWFEKHRADYEAGYLAPALSFIAALGPEFRKISPHVKFEPRINGSLFRINRDVRFSKDKAPYKHHIDLWFWLGERKGWDAPGFWFRLLHDKLMLGAGMHGFMGPVLDKYRKAVVDDKSGKALLAAVAEVKGYEIGGASRKRVPRGFDENHPRAQFLLHEGLHAGLEIAVPKEAKSAAFVGYCADHFRRVWPIARWLRGVL